MPRILSAERAFACAACGAQAGIVQLFGPAGDAELIRQSFTSRLTARIPAEGFESVRGIILSGEIQPLYDWDQEVASFYCPSCHCCYCGEHWIRRDVFEEDDGFTWHDSIRGRCPQGHERMLED